MIRLGLVLGLLALAPTAHAAPPPGVDELLAALARTADKTESLSGRFTQTNRLRLFKKELKSEGRFSFARPRRIRWEYLAPDPSTLVLEGERATLTAPGAAPQVFDLGKDATMRAIFDQLLIWLSPGALAGAKADYALTTTGSATAPVLVLTPKQDNPVARAFRRIELTFDGKSHLIRSILLVEQNGDEKHIVFSQLAPR